MSHTTVLIFFNIFVLGMLALDLGVFNRKAHAITIKEAAIWSGVWVALSLLFCSALFIWESHTDGLEFLTGYLIEKALSVDNIFVFIMIFAYFGVPAKYHHKVLFWGILGALILRATFIVIGTALLSEFHWVMYVFGVILLYTGIKMFRSDTVEVHPEKNIVLKYCRKVFPVTENYVEGRFFARINRKLYLTPMFLVLIVIETTDIVFAFDSIPAIFAITQDPFIVYTSNICAILGLRALYFLLAGLMRRFEYLQTGVAVVLVYIAIKMLIMDIYKIPIAISLAGVILILGVSIIASIRKQKKEKSEPAGE